MQICPPYRVRRTYIQTLCAAAEVVFPLLCPVREADWIPGWDPLLVISHSGVAEVGCVFLTLDGTREAIWTVTEHDARFGRVAFVKVTPGLVVTRIHIELSAEEQGCSASITYEHTALGPEGEAFVGAFTEARFQGFMALWEARLNHYLETGGCLT